MFFKKYCHKYLIYILLSIILYGCQLQEPINSHGIVFLENKSNKLIVNKSNLNDAVRIVGIPHSTSINNKNEWYYFERVLSKGEYYKLGQNLLKENNVLVLKFDKYGILKSKNFLDKNDKNKIIFSEDETVNEIRQKSSVEKFLNSIKTKMYGNK